MALEFEADWRRLRGDLVPLAYLLRCKDIPWVRFHALPLSKRYAETKEEYETVLTRANQLALETLGDAAECWLIQCAYPGFSGLLNQVGGETAVPAFGFRPEDDAENWSVYGNLTTWRPTHFDELLRAIADDELHYVSWMNRKSGAIFAPYDGGFDLFPPTEAAVEKLSQSYKDWLSPHPLRL
jgi:hypothetical protein